MKYLFALCFCLTLAILFSSCSHELAPQGHFQSSQVTADGNTDDWQLPLRFSNSNYSLSYNITNDNNNIYICVLTKDEQMQRRILNAGMDVYFDAKGAKNKTTDLNFPEKNTNAANSNLQRNRMHITATDAIDFNTSGFSNIENGQYSRIDKQTKIQVAIKMNNDSNLVYEAVVPINTVIGKDLDAKALKKNFTVGIAVGRLAGNSAVSGRYNDQLSNNNAAVQPRMSIVGGGMRGGGMGMGRGMRGGGYAGRSPNTPQSKPKSEDQLWYTFRFIDKQSS